MSDRVAKRSHLFDLCDPCEIALRALRVLCVFRGQIWYNELTGELLSPRTPPKTEDLSAISEFQRHRLRVSIISAALRDIMATASHGFSLQHPCHTGQRIAQPLLISYKQNAK